MKASANSRSRTVGNWRWWIVLPVMLLLFPLVLFNEVASFVHKISYWTSGNVVHPMYQWVNSKKRRGR